MLRPKKNFIGAPEPAVAVAASACRPPLRPMAGASKFFPHRNWPVLGQRLKQSWGYDYTAPFRRPGDTSMQPQYNLADTATNKSHCALFHAARAKNRFLHLEHARWVRVRQIHIETAGIALNRTCAPQQSGCDFTIVAQSAPDNVVARQACLPKITTSAEKPQAVWLRRDHVRKRQDLFPPPADVSF